MANVIGFYHWHPYELQAFVCGVLVGLIFGVRIGVLWARRR